MPQSVWIMNNGWKILCYVNNPGRYQGLLHERAPGIEQMKSFVQSIGVLQHLTRSYVF